MFSVPASRGCAGWKVHATLENLRHLAFTPPGRSSLLRAVNQSARKTILPVRVILVRPGQGRNVGAAVRAAANFGAESVRVVAEAASWSDEEQRQARIASAGAWDLIGGIRLHPDLADASHGCTVLAGTSARPRKGAGAPVTPAEFFASRRPPHAGPVGLVFGPESQGLPAADLARCHVWLRVPTTAEFPSLNLAQAVLLLLAEAFRCWGLVAGSDTRQPDSRPARPPDAGQEASPVASLESQEAFLARWVADPREAAQFRRLLHRAQPAPGDLALLENLLNRLKKGRADRG